MNINVRLAELDMTRSQVARKLGVSPSMMNYWFSRKKEPSLSQAIKLAEVLQISITELAKYWEED